MPPRYGKTELAVKNFIAKGLAINPQSKFIHLSYASSLALDNSEEIRDFVASSFYNEIFPNIKISNTSSAKNKWYTTQGGGVYATSTGGQITGFGAGEVDEEEELTEALDEFKTSNKFAGAIVIDDALKPDDADSEVKRERINQRFENTIRSRANSRDTPIIIIGQAVHERDLIGYLLETEPEKWELLDIPAIIIEDGEEVALWSFKQTIEELQHLRSLDARTFNSQYMQNPMPIEGYLMPKSNLRLIPNKHDSELIKRYCFIDPSEKNGDMMSAIFLQSEEFNGKINFHIYDVVHSNKGFEVTSEIIHQKAIDSKVDEIIFEKNGVGLATGIKLKNLNTELDYKLTPYHSSENKEAKILKNYEFALKYLSFNSAYEEDRVFKSFITDLTTYSSEVRRAHKSDAMDVVCSAVKIIKLKYNNFFSII